jgi:hypothetical protein
MPLVTARRTHTLLRSLKDWVIDYDGVVEAPYNTAGPYTLNTCYDMCENGTWANCLAFSR